MDLTNSYSSSFCLNCTKLLAPVHDGCANCFKVITRLVLANPFIKLSFVHIKQPFINLINLPCSLLIMALSKLHSSILYYQLRCR